MVKFKNEDYNTKEQLQEKSEEKDYTNVEKYERKNLENYTVQIIQQFFYILNFEKLRIIVDIVSLMEEKSIYYDFSNERANMNDKMEYAELPQFKIKLGNKKKALYDYCIRNELNKNNLLYTLQSNEKTDIILTEIHNFIEENEASQENDGENEEENDSKIIKENNYKDFILPLEDAKKLESIKKISTGFTSEIEFLHIDDKNKKNIENQLNHDIGNKIVKKNFLVSDYLKSDTTPNKITDIDIINSLGGLDGLLNREINVLKKVFGYKHFPYLLCIDQENKCIYMTYCGKSINEDNIPENWEEQINDCVKILNREKIFHNDLWAPNILVLDDIIKIIDFGFGSFNNENFPFTNLKKNKKYSNFFEYLDMCVKKGGERRIQFHKNLNNKK